MPMNLKKPKLGKIRSGFLPLGMGAASGVRAHPQRRSPMPGSGSSGNSGYRYKLNSAGVSKRGKKMY